MFNLASPEEQLKNCFSFITTWMLSFPQRGIFHLGLVFCRHNIMWDDFTNMNKIWFMKVYLHSICCWSYQGGPDSSPFVNPHIHHCILCSHHHDISCQVSKKICSSKYYFYEYFSQVSEQWKALSGLHQGIVMLHDKHHKCYPGWGSQTQDL